MAIQITAVRLEGGNTHEHITRLKWYDPADGRIDDNSRAEIVAWIENQNGKAYVEDAQHHRVDVHVIAPYGRPKYLRTKADGIETNNLLYLPRF
ncbi:DUF3892 domain-containing protein [Dactylosporangium sp. CA-052675]|uniref:DUF3892 domain-containing protein n=1 Tax=Dactylosporangium sp. CA-052675 TaxID=3239927 RepID=UPI003D8C84EE